MDVPGVLALFEEQMRRSPAPEPGQSVERESGITRLVGPPGSWRGIPWSDLRGGDVDAVIGEQIRRFGPWGEWEWKLYSYDEPTDLSDRLVAAGFVPEESETVVVGSVEDLDLVAEPPAGVDLVAVVDQTGVDALVATHNTVFERNYDHIGRALRAGLEADPPTVAAVVALADGLPVSAGRIEFPEGRDFAGLWGGGTLPAWRGRGVYRSLVAHRAAMAASRGYRYLQVDASAESLPILIRLGFTELATTTPYRWSPRSPVVDDPVGSPE